MSEKRLEDRAHKVKMVTRMRVPSSSPAGPPTIPPTIMKLGQPWGTNVFCPGFGKGWSSRSLQSMVIDVVINCTAVALSISQTFINNLERPMEATYSLPVGPRMAVFGFDVTKDGETVSARLKSSADAKDSYDDAISSGNVGAIGERSTKGKFTIALGNLQPDAVVSTKVHLVCPVESRDAVLSFCLPGALLPAEAGNYELTINVRATFPGGCDMSVSQSGHVEICQDGVWTSKEPVAQADTLVVEISPKKAFEPNVVVEQSLLDGKSFAAVLTFFPSWKQLDADLVTPYVEVVFLVDRSGSMDAGYGPSRGLRIKKARETLALFLASLPANCRVQIVGFGDSFECLWQSPQEYNPLTLQVAQQHALGMGADLGGTNLLKPLNYILCQEELPEYPRHIFVLTDGKLESDRERDQTISYVQDHCKFAKVYAVGIGSGADRVLVEGLARAGGGLADMIDDKDDMRPVVMRQLARALEPTLRKVEVKFEGFEAQRVVPEKLPPVANGERLTVYALGLTGSSGVVTVTGVAPDEQPFVWRMNLDASTSLGLEKGELIHRMAAWEVIRTLEDLVKADHSKKKEIEALALKYSLASSQTSFVASVENSTFVDQPIVAIDTKGPSKGPSFWKASISTWLGGKRNHGEILDEGIESSNDDDDDDDLLEEVEEVKGGAKEEEKEKDMMIESKMQKKLASPDSLATRGKASGRSYQTLAKTSPPPAPSAMPPPQQAYRQRGAGTELSPQPKASPPPSSVSSPLSSLSSSAKMDPILGLATAQNAAGFWGEDVVTILSGLSKDFANASPAHLDDRGVDKTVLLQLWISALVLAWLRKNHLSEESTWRLFSQKARSWIKKKQLSLGLDSIDFISAATSYLS